MIISYEDFVNLISKPKYNLTELGISSTTIWKYLKRIFPERDSKDKACTYLLKLYELKYCPKCEFVLDFSYFFKSKNTATGTSSYCKMCDKEAWSDWYADNKADHLFRVSGYRTRLLRALPKWADLDKIKEVYRNRPEGCHVDHIYPLKGDIVCGLHVHNNLQYLTPAENLSKGNKYLV